MKWITRERVKVDRVACPWLITKFVNPDVEFIFLPHSTDWASIQDGIVYDLPACELGHHVPEVSFDAFLKKYGLTEWSVTLLAQIVRAADSHPGNQHPLGEGVRWIAHWFISVLDLSGHDILAQEFVVYDALFAECKKRVSA
jgi:hypothetical protein